MGTVKAVCTSAIKGIQKEEVPYVELRPEWGIEDDAHAGPWHPQVSLISFERIQGFNERGAGVANGAFGENLIVEGVFCKVLEGGRIAPGDLLDLVEQEG